MFEYIKGVKIKGRCFDEETDLQFFESKENNISLVYGRNGSGKSSISNAFETIRKRYITEEEISNFVSNELNNDSFEITDIICFDDKNISNDSYKNIFVFNENYIEKKIKIKEDDLDAIVLFGQDVDIDNELNQLDKDGKDILDKRNDIMNDIKILTDKCTDSLKNGKNMLKNRWSTNNQNILGNKSKSPVTDDVFFKIGKQKDQKNIDDLNIYDLNEDFQKKYNLYTLLPKNNNATLKLLNRENIKYTDRDIIELLSKEITGNIESDLGSEIFKIYNKKGLSYINDIKETFKDEKVEKCPFCFQDISNAQKKDILNVIKTIINEKTNVHLKELDIEIKKIQAFQPLEYKILLKNDKDDLLLEQVRDQIDKCNTIIEYYNNCVQNKKNKPYEPIKIESQNLDNEILLLNEYIDNLNIIIINFNEIVQNKETKQKELQELNRQIAYFEIQIYHEEYIKYKNLLEEKNVEKEKYEAEYYKIKERIDDLNIKKLDHKVAVDIINRYLKLIFYDNNFLQIKVEGSYYYIKRNNKKIKPNQLSTGERNVLALCYFFLEIFNKKEEKNLYQEELFIIIDDPVSSFDVLNRIGIQTFLNSQFSKILKGNSKSKIILLSHDFDLIHTMSEAYKNKRKLYILKDYKLEEEKKVKEYSEYKSLLNNIFKYACNRDNDDNNIANDYTIGNIMRRVFEGYCTFIYNKSFIKIDDIIEKEPLNRDLYETLFQNKTCELDTIKNYFSNFMYRIALHSESHGDYKAKNFQYNIFDSCLTKEEKVRTAKDMLCFMYLYQTGHIMAYLEYNEKDKVDEIIEGWIMNINQEYSNT